MRPSILVRLTAVCALAGSLAAAVHAADVLSQLGIPPDSAKEAVQIVLNSGVNNPGLPAKLFKATPAIARAEMASAGIAWVKAYTASAEFAAKWAEIRETHKPAKPEFAGTPEEELKRADEEQTQQAEESKKALASLPPETRKQIEDGMKAADAIRASMDTPEMRKTRLAAIVAMREERTKQFGQEMATWKRDYPESPAPAIAKRIREFLAFSADVDFGATLVAKDGRMVFENPAYEAKSSQWKMCFRAGKEATAAARAAAQAWLKELGA
jgi:antitoxin component of RelBE/YafQ-DinJ toxin-antitoxin module